MADRWTDTDMNEPSWVREARPRMEAAYELGRQARVAPSLLADAIDHYEQWRAEAERLRAENAALREAGDAMGKRLHDWWHPCSGQVLAEAKVPCDNCDAIEAWRALSAPYPVQDGET